MKPGGFEDLFFSLAPPSLEFFPSLESFLEALQGWQIIKSKKAGSVGRLLLCRINKYTCYLAPVVFFKDGLGFLATISSLQSPLRFHTNEFSRTFFSKNYDKAALARHLSSLHNYQLRLIRKLWKNA